MTVSSSAGNQGVRSTAPTAIHARRVDDPIRLDCQTDVLSDLVVRALGDDADAAARLVMAIRSHGVSAERIFADLFEPAARRLGDLWQEDRCSQFEITIALGRFQTLVRMLGQNRESLDSECPGSPRKRFRILIATAPGGALTLASSLSAHAFLKAGWRVTCDFPRDDDELGRLLDGRRYDALDLSLSSVFREEHRLGIMRNSVRIARKASLNRQLVVLASGRLFFERPELSLVVGADCAGRSAAEAAGRAEQLVFALKIPEYARLQAALRGVAQKAGDKALNVGALQGQEP